jgi:hypothetical protein
MTVSQVHVDLDNLWIYERKFGIALDESRAIYEGSLVRMLEIFRMRNVKATFFAVGRDLEELAACREFCRYAVVEGHEIANHTYGHDVNWTRLSGKTKAEDIQRTHALILDATGCQARGFRAPGYSIDRETIEILIGKGYLYDSSLLPGWGTVGMRAFLLAGGGGTKAYDTAYGRLSDVFATTSCFKMSTPAGSLLEMPISVFPWLRLPIHTTFVYRLGWKYLELALWAVRSQSPETVIYLCHATDLLDFEREVKGGGHPALLASRWSLAERTRMLSAVVERLERPLVTATSFLSASGIDPLATVREMRSGGGSEG